MTEKEDLVQCRFNQTDLDQKLEKIITEFPYYRFIFAFAVLDDTKIYIRNLVKSEANIMNSLYREKLQNFKNIVASKF